MTTKKAVFTIESVASLTEIPDYWSSQDYIELLKIIDVPVANNISDGDCLEYLQMAVSEMKPNEAAQIFLNYKLHESLNEGQIEQISNDMLIDKISEEYPDISLHYDLYSINQLLYTLYNGSFPNAKAVRIQITVDIEDHYDALTKEEILKYLMEMVSGRSVIKRLFAEKLTQGIAFEEAEFIIWKLDQDQNKYSIYTSEYWITDEQVIKSKIETDYFVM